MNRLIKSLLVFCILAATFALPVIPAKAQMPGINTEIISLTSDPAFPAPGNNVTIFAEAATFDLSSADIVWTVNDAVVKSGKGIRNISIICPIAGRSAKIMVKATLGDKSLIGNLELKGGDITLLWEADTYTPPFYRGKALSPYGGIIKVVALPDLYRENGSKYFSSELSYQWSKNGANMSESNGVGKNVFYTNDKTFAEDGNEISVAVSSPNKNYIATKTLIPHSNPLVIFYPSDPLLGYLYNKAILGDYISKDSRIFITVAPYFFSGDKSANSLTWDWTIDGASYSGFSSELIFDSSLFKNASTLFSLNIASPKSPLQIRENSFNFKRQY